MRSRCQAVHYPRCNFVQDFLCCIRGRGPGYNVQRGLSCPGALYSWAVLSNAPWDMVDPVHCGIGTPLWTDRQTENITFPDPLDVGGKKFNPFKSLIGNNGFAPGWQREAWKGYDATIKRIFTLPGENKDGKSQRSYGKSLLLVLPLLVGLSVFTWKKLR